MTLVFQIQKVEQKPDFVTASRQGIVVERERHGCLRRLLLVNAKLEILRFEPTSKSDRTGVSASGKFYRGVERQKSRPLVLEDHTILCKNGLLEIDYARQRTFPIDDRQRHVGETFRFADRLNEEANGVIARRIIKNILVEHDAEGRHYPICIVRHLAAPRRFRCRRLVELAIDRPDLIGILSVFRLVSQNFSTLRRAEYVRVNEREVGHIEEILDDSKRARVDADASATRDSPVRLVEFRNFRERSSRLAERRENATILGLYRQLSTLLSVFITFKDFEQIDASPTDFYFLSE